MSGTTLPAGEPGRTSASRAGKYLTFGLGQEEYGLEILKVREIIGFMRITAIPRLPAHVKGVINLRGQVICVVDLRARFEMPPVEQTEATCIIVVETQQEGRKISTGIIVDRVSEVLTITNENVQEAPRFGGAISTDFILGVGKVGVTVKILLDINKILTAADSAVAEIDRGIQTPA